MQSHRHFFSRWARAAKIIPIVTILGLCRVAEAQVNPTLGEMIAKANSLTDLSSAVPYELHARIVVEAGSEKAQQGEVTIYRDHVRSRIELQLSDFHQVVVVDEGKRYVSRSRSYPLAGLDVLNEVEDAVQVHNEFAGTKFKNHLRSIGGIPASCFEKQVGYSKIRFCFDSNTGAVLEISDYSGLQSRFSAYAAAGAKSFPARIELRQPGKPRRVELSDIQVTTRTFDDASFAVPRGANAFPACGRAAAAWPLLDEPWEISRTRVGEVYVYAIVEADGRAHDLTIYGGSKWVQREVSKMARKWDFVPARCGRTTIASEAVLPLVRVYGAGDSSGASSDSYSTSSASSLFDRPQNLNTDINNYINTANDH